MQYSSSGSPRLEPSCQASSTCSAPGTQICWFNQRQGLRFSIRKPNWRRREFPLERFAHLSHSRPIFTLWRADADGSNSQQLANSSLLPESARLVRRSLVLSFSRSLIVLRDYFAFLLLSAGLWGWTLLAFAWWPVDEGRSFDII